MTIPFEEGPNSAPLWIPVRQSGLFIFPRCRHEKTSSRCGPDRRGRNLSLLNVLATDLQLLNR
jgi:hypothetical protein